MQMMEKLNRQIAVLAVVIVVLVILDVALAISEPFYTHWQGAIIAKLGNTPAIEISKDGWLCGTPSSVGPNERFVLLEILDGRMACMRVTQEEYDRLLVGSIVDVDWGNVWR